MLWHIHIVNKEVHSILAEHVLYVAYALKVLLWLNGANHFAAIWHHKLYSYLRDIKDPMLKYLIENYFLRTQHKKL